MRRKSKNILKYETEIKIVQKILKKETIGFGET